MPVQTPKPAVRPRRADPLGGSARDRRAIGIGLASTALIHVLLLVLAPFLPGFSRNDGRFTPAKTDDPTRAFDIRLVPEEPAPPPRFVEVNPAAPANVPDRTQNIGAQNQQVAQPVPTPDGRSDTPAVTGDPDKQSSAIVSGWLSEPQPVAPPPEPSAEATEEASADAARLALNSLSGFENLLGESDGSVGTTVARVPGTDAEPVEGAPDGTAQGTARIPAVDPQKPKPRPRLDSSIINTRPAPLLNNAFGTRNVGAVAYDAKWSEFGEYMQRLVDAVDVQWHRLNRNSDTYPIAGTMVSVRFRLNTRGEVSEIVSVGGNAGQAVSYLCVSAITSRAPYGVWSDDMTAVLGDSQEITFRFFYE